MLGTVVGGVQEGAAAAGSQVGHQARWLVGRRLDRHVAAIVMQVTSDAQHDLDIAPRLPR